ncbi:hypothetical protein DOY81_010005, partial [Sarcophaga bullata]
QKGKNQIVKLKNKKICLKIIKMDSINTEDNSGNVKEEFKDWLKKYYEDLSITLNTLTSTTMAMDIMPSKAQILLEDKVNKLKTKSEQLKKCNDTINAKVEEESKNIRKNFFEMLTKDDITLKVTRKPKQSYLNIFLLIKIVIKALREVEAAIKDVKEQTDSLKTTTK